MKSKPTVPLPTKERTRKYVSSSLTFLLLLMGFASVASPAQAAEGTPTEITKWKFQDSGELSNGSQQWLDVEWQATTQLGATPPVAVAFDLPPELEGTPETFEIRDGSNTRSGSCTVSQGSVECSLDDDYVIANPNNIKGTFSMRAWLKFDAEGLTEPQERSLTIAGYTHSFVVKPGWTPGAPCEGEACAWDPDVDTGEKYGDYDEQTGDVDWQVWVPSVSSEANWMSTADRTMQPGLQVEVTDRFQAGQSYVSGPKLYALSCIAHSAEGYEYITGWRDVTDSVDATVSDDLQTLSFTTQEAVANPCAGVQNDWGAPDSVPAPYPVSGAVYVATWKLHNDNHALGGKQSLSNVADITINGHQTPRVERSIQIQIAGGSGGGDMTDAIPGIPVVIPAECGPGDTGEVWEDIELPVGGFFTYDYTASETYVATVTATPILGATLSGGVLPDGWTANGDGTASWTHQLESKVCDVTVVPTVPPVGPAECTADSEGGTVWESVVQPVSGGGITYSDVVVDDAGVATVVATLDPGHVFGELGDGWVLNGDGTASWTHQLESKVCETDAGPITPKPPIASEPPVGPKPPITPALPIPPSHDVPTQPQTLEQTGGTLPGWTVGGAALLLAGGVTVAMLARRGRLRG